MSIINDTIEFYEGNIQILSFTLTDNDNGGAALDLTNLTLKWALSKADDLDPIMYKTTPKLEKTEGAGIVITNPPGTDGLCRVTISTADTAPGNPNEIKPGIYYWELEATDTLSERTVLAVGTFTILKNVVNS